MHRALWTRSGLRVAMLLRRSVSWTLFEALHPEQAVFVADAKRAKRIFATLSTNQLWRVMRINFRSRDDSVLSWDVTLLLVESSLLTTAVCNKVYRWSSRDGITHVVRALSRLKRADPSTDDNFALRAAARNGHTSVVRVLLADSRVDPSAKRCESVFTALRGRHWPVVHLLRNDWRIKQAYLSSIALSLIKMLQHVDTVKLFLINRNKFNQALEVAAAAEHVAVVHWILSTPKYTPSYAAVNAAFSDACSAGNTCIMLLLLRNACTGALLDSDAIHVAAENGHFNIVKLLLADKRLDPTKSDHLSIRLAAEFGYTDIVRLLLADGRANPAACSNFCICSASENGHTDVVRLLLADDRVDPSAFDNHAIRMAAQEGYIDIVKLLLADERVDPSASENGAIRAAARYGHADVVKLLLADERVDPRARNNEAYCSACDCGFRDVLVLLMEL